MNKPLSTGIENWLQLETSKKSGCYKLEFSEHHLGNTFIRSLHGGVSGSLIEVCAEKEVRAALGDDDAGVSIITCSIDYLRITRDTDLFAQVEIKRISRRMAVVHVTCWQDDENAPVVQGVVTLKINRT